MRAVNHLCKNIKEQVGAVIVGKEQVTELAVIALLCEGHMLLDDVPGTGKTVLAKTFAKALFLGSLRECA